MVLQDSMLHIKASYLPHCRLLLTIPLCGCPDPLWAGMRVLRVIAARHLHSRELIRQSLVLRLPCALLRITGGDSRRASTVGRHTVRRLRLLMNARGRAARSRLVRVHIVRRTSFLRSQIGRRCLGELSDAGLRSAQGATAREVLL